MAKDPAFLFYSSDFLTGTAFLTFEDKGKYILILCHMHQHGGSLTDESIRFLVGSVSDNLKDKFIIDGIKWRNKRLDEEMEKRNNFINSRKNNGKLGGRPKANEKLKDNLKDNHMPNLPENENVIVNKDVSNTNTIRENFEIFWNGYGVDLQRNECEHIWCRLSNLEMVKAMEHCKEYARVTPKEFRKHPATYLEKAMFNDEIIDRRPKGEISLKDKYK